jgi:hypothetical protein
LPLGIGDFPLTSGAIGLAEKVFSKGPVADEKDE